jgi:hypothetical protein
MYFTSVRCLARRNAQDAISRFWALRTITIAFPGALIVIPVSQHVANVHAPLDNHPVPVAFLVMNGRDQTVLVPANVEHDAFAGEIGASDGLAYRGEVDSTRKSGSAMIQTWHRCYVVSDIRNVGHHGVRQAEIHGAEPDAPLSVAS